MELFNNLYGLLVVNLRLGIHYTSLVDLVYIIQVVLGIHYTSHTILKK